MNNGPAYFAMTLWQRAELIADASLQDKRPRGTQRWRRMRDAALKQLREAVAQDRAETPNPRTEAMRQLVQGKPPATQKAMIMQARSTGFIDDTATETLIAELELREA